MSSQFSDTSWGERFQRAPGPAGIDLLVVALCLVAAFVGFGPVFGGYEYLIAAGVGLLAGLNLAALGAWRRFGVLVMAALTIVAYLLFGGVAALRHIAIGGVIPNGETFTQLIVGVVRSWKALLTIAPPASTFPELLVLPFASVLLAAVTAGSFAIRLARPAWALLPIFALLIETIVFGTHDVVLPIVQGGFIALVSLLWLAWRRATMAKTQTEKAEVVGRVDESGRPGGQRRALGVLSIVLVGALAAFGGSALAAPGTPRTIARDTIEPPLELKDFPSPLMGFRHYVKDTKEQTLFEVKNLPVGARLSLGTLTSYDGIVYNVSGPGTGKGNMFQRVGSKLDSPEIGTPAEVTVKVGSYSDVWIPTVGRPTNVSFNGNRSDEIQSSTYFNSTTSTALTTNGLVKGDEYTLSTVLPEAMLGAVSDEQLTQRVIAANPGLPDNTEVPDAVSAKAPEFTAGAVEPWDLARKIQSNLAQNGGFCHGFDGTCESRAGHNSARITNFLVGERTLVGDDEQFAVVMALLARDQGLPARVVMGFYPGEDKPSNPQGWTKITGDDIHVWVEIAFEGVGWVPYDPTPNEDQTPTETTETPDPKPIPVPLQPPPPPQAGADAPQDVEQDRKDLSDKEEDEAARTALVIVAVAVAIPLILVVLPIAYILFVKASRRKKRRGTGTGYARATGGWDEVLDRATDLGASLPEGATRRETAVILDEKYPTAGIGQLARGTDEAVFGALEPGENQINILWAQVASAISTMKASVGKWGRIRSGLSLRSIRNARLARRLARGASRVAGDSVAKPRRQRGARRVKGR